MKKISVAALRREYRSRGFDETLAQADPMDQFRQWFENALHVALPDPNAMTLATADPKARPSSRVVLLKSFDGRGFVFFTNYQSQKARQLTENPQASLLFYWSGLDRQVRIDGLVKKTSGAESDAYFKTRPLGSQLSAWASPQSEVIESRQELESWVETVKERYPGSVPRPSYWGGYRLVPDYFEFWQGRAERLHDRICYRRTSKKKWSLKRLAP
ncbi:MAG: pyridoxamine 5'-phosphate oxidase [Acidobacteriota bacterium]